MIGCDCAVCHSSDPKNHRYRSCLHVETDSGFSILIDTPPELRLAAIRSGLKRVDAVLFTHSHADHIFGLDDLRTFNWLQQQEIPLYAEAPVLDDLSRAFSYIWRETQAGGGKPRLTLNPIAVGTSFVLGGLTIDALRVFHGELPILAFRFDKRVSYVTDVSAIPEETSALVAGSEILLLDAVRRRPHPTHFHFDRALEVVRELKPKQTFFVHLSHDFDHDATEKELPADIRLSYDGMVLTA